MRLGMVLLFLALATGVIQGCFGAGYEQRVKDNYDAKVTAYTAANPGQPITEAKAHELMDSAVAEVKAELVKAYGEGAGGVITEAAKGNLLGAGILVLGMVGMFFGKKKEKKVVA